MAIAFSEKFLRRADEGHSIAVRLDQGCHSRKQFSVRDVTAIPGQKVLDLMYGGHSDMKCVCKCLVGEHVLLNDVKGEILGSSRDLKEADVRKNGQAAGSSIMIPASGFLKNQQGCDQIKFGSPRLPPLSRDLLVGGHDEVPGRPRRQVADDRGFEVDPCTHRGILPLPDETKLSGERSESAGAPR